MLTVPTIQNAVSPEWQSGTATDSQPIPQIIMIGAAVSAEMMEELRRVDPVPQVQTYHLQWAVIHGLESATQRPLQVLSTVPVRDYPYSCKAIWWGSRSTISGGEGRSTDLTIMPFVNVLGLKQITRFVSCAVYLAKRASATRRAQPKVAILYGLIISHLVAALILRPLLGLRVTMIITDPPTPDQSDEGRLYKLARKVDRSLLRWCMRRLDGIIPLARPLADHMAPGLPCCVMEGMISDEVVRHAAPLSPVPVTRRADAPMVVMYAGTLNERCYGIEQLLGVFDLLKDRNVEFWVFGKGRLEARIKEAASENPKVKFLGFAKPSDVLAKMSEADVMINPRPEVPDVTPYSFPSKLLEYMAMGKVVIGGRLAGIPEGYHLHYFSLRDVTATSLAAAIEEVMAWSPRRREELGQQARRFVWGRATQEVQGRRLLDFLTGVSVR